MASLWLAKSYSFMQVIAVEPDPNNAALVRQNLELNGIAGQVLEAAIGPKEPVAQFESSELSNLRRLSQNGSILTMISSGTIIQKFSLTRLALMKIGMAGAE